MMVGSHVASKDKKFSQVGSLHILLTEGSGMCLTAQGKYISGNKSVHLPVK